LLLRAAAAAIQRRLPPTALFHPDGTKMVARVTTGPPSRAGRSRARIITDVPLLATSASIIAVEPNRRTEGSALPVETRQDVIFSVSLDTDGIWRIDRFNSAFVEIFSERHRPGSNGAQYTVPFAFASKLAGALSRCAENGRSVRLDVSVQIEGHLHLWEFLLEAADGPDAIPHHILVHGHDVTGQQQTAAQPPCGG
jgi:hypothetical protein